MFHFHACHACQIGWLHFHDAGTAEQAGLFQAQRKVSSRGQQFRTKYTRIMLDHEMVRLGTLSQLVFSR